MDINNIQALIAQGLITDVASVDPNKAYVAVGVYQPGNRQSGPAGNAYPSYAMPISEFLAAGGVYTASNGISLVGNDFQLSSILISQFTNDTGYITSGGGTTDLDPVISQTNVVPGSPVSGDRYLAGTTPGAPWIANSIEEWNGASWVTTAPVLDDVVFITSTLSTLRYNGSAWVPYVGTAVLNQGNTTTSALVIGTNTAQALVFKTNNIESARVLINGNWGIGTTTPAEKLHVHTNGFPQNIIFSSEHDSSSLTLNTGSGGFIGSGGSTITLQTNSVSTGQFYSNTSVGATFVTSLGGYSLVLSNGSAQAIGLGVSGNNIAFNTGGTEKMILDGVTGNLGIGAGLPTSKLQVVGLPTYADNVTASGAGLTVGAMYIRTGHGLDIVV